MIENEVAHPAGVRLHLGGSARRNKAEVSVELGKSFLVTVHVVKVRIAQRHQTREVVALSVEYLVHGHLLNGIVQHLFIQSALLLGPIRNGCRVTRGAWCAGLVCAVGARGCWRRRRGLRCGSCLSSGHIGGRVARAAVLASVARHHVLAKEEFLLAHRVDLLGPLHVLIDEGQGHDKVKIEHKEHASEEHNEDGEGRVLKIRHLNLHRAELGPPTNVVPIICVIWVLRRRRLPAHGLPVRTLNVLPMIRCLLVRYFLHRTLEHHQRITHKEVSDVARQHMVAGGLHDQITHLFVHLTWHIVVHVWRLRAQVTRDRIVPRLLEGAHPTARHLRVGLGVRP
mmetsp:Transcript_7148/g.17264  ORF Transcript_7148/g.17264 Transcript_7148/m.17264 type:complete len:340 (+) Transcript_7148:504-1523(+)